MKIVEEMLAAANALNEAELDYAICGGIAVGSSENPLASRPVAAPLARVSPSR